MLIKCCVMFRCESIGFRDVLSGLERSSGYSLLSYLTLPLQRVSRLPLLVEKILRRLEPSSSEFTAAQAALSALTLVYIILIIYPNH
jgi:hypothetical protein